MSEFFWGDLQAWTFPDLSNNMAKSDENPVTKLVEVATNTDCPAAPNYTAEPENPAAATTWKKRGRVEATNTDCHAAPNTAEPENPAAATTWKKRGRVEATNTDCPAAPNTAEPENPATWKKRGRVEATNTDCPAAPNTAEPENPATWKKRGRVEATNTAPAPQTAEPENPTATTGKKRGRVEATNTALQTAEPENPAAATTGKKRGGKGNKTSGERKGNKGTEDHESHIFTERERRKKMTNMFLDLHDLLPELPLKADKSKVVYESINYIKKLQETLKKLQKQKLERLQSGTAASGTISHESSTTAGLQALVADYQVSASINHISPPAIFPTATFNTWNSSNVVVSVIGDHAHISVSCSKKMGLLSTICCFLEKYSIDLISLQISSDQYRTVYMINAHANELVQELVSDEIISFEVLFRQLAADIGTYITNPHQDQEQDQDQTIT